MSGLDRLLKKETIARAGFSEKPDLQCTIINGNGNYPAKVYFSKIIGKVLTVSILQIEKSETKYYVYHWIGPCVKQISKEEQQELVQNLYTYGKERPTCKNFLDITVQSMIDEYSA